MPATAEDMTQEKMLMIRIDSGIATLTLNRPGQFNALSREMLLAMEAALDDIAQDESVRVVIIAANGKAFCAGHDLKEMRSSEERAFHQSLFDQCSKVMGAIHQLPQPVIAKVQGLATAAGCQLVAQCDLAVAVDTARFAVSGIRVGLFCSTPAVPLSRTMPQKQAMQMLLTGDFIDAEMAKASGLVNEVVRAAQLDLATRDLAERIIGKSSLSIRLGKKMFYEQLNMGLSEAYDFASERMACNMDSEDAREGIDAFIEKRKPNWKGK